MDGAEESSEGAEESLEGGEESLESGSPVSGWAELGETAAVAAETSKAGSKEGGALARGKKWAGLSLSTVTETGFLFFSMVKTLSERWMTGKGPS